MALATAIYWIVLGPALAWLEPSDAMLPLAQGYMSQRFFGSIGLIAAMTFSSFFRGIGDTRTPLYAALVANIANAILDYGLIFGHFGLPAWGVEGAGTATALGEWINFFVLAFALQRPAVRSIYWTRVVAPDWSAIGRVLRVGIPVGGQWLLEMLSFAAFLTLVARMGDGPMAASQIFIALLSISFMQAIGLSIGVSTLVGQYVGAEQHPAVFASFWSGMKLAAVLAGVIALVLVAFPDLLLSIFTSDPEVLALGRPLLRLGALYQVFDAFAILADGALRGAGDTRWPFAIRCVLAWGFFLPAAYLLGVYLDGGLTNAWAAGVVYAFILAVILVRRFTSGAWKQIQI
jgi:MATE family multidrug resistance protein